jgi:preprotein translocase subunit SecE
MAIEQRASTKTAASGGSGSSADPSLQRTRNTLLETWVELKKTTWPSKEEATRLTMVVIGVIIVLGIYMGLLDTLLSFFFNKVLG